MIKEIVNNIKEKYKDYYVSDIISGEDLKMLVDEIERLNNILNEIDLIFYRMRFVGFNSKNDELKFLYENINEVRKICQNKKLKESE